MSSLAGVTPFPPEFAARYRARGYWEDVPLGRFYAGVFASHGDRVAMVNGSERVTYTELRERVARLALHLLGLGVVPLDRWVVQLPNIPEFVYLYFALEQLGAIPIMALAGHRWNEINSFFELSGANGYAVTEMLGDFDSRALIAQIREAHSGVRTILSAETIRDLLRSNTPLDARLLDTVEDDCLLVALPIAHNFPLACPGISGFFWKGARVVLTESPRADNVLPLIERERITHLELVPALLIRYINTPGVADRDLSSVRVINTGGQN